MRALLLTSFGPVSNFTVAEIPRPKTVSGHVLVRVRASSVNPIDTKIRRLGPPIAPALPAVLGVDFAGHIEAVHGDVSGWKEGDEVFGCGGGVRGVHGGALAEFLLVDSRTLARKPKRLSMKEAAALPLVSITAYQAISERLQVTAGEDILIKGATGGVGHIALQLAAVAGARVTATASSAEKDALARSLGATEVTRYKNEDLAAATHRITDGRGFDAVLDATGGSDLADAFRVVRPGARVGTIVSQYTADLTLMHSKSLTLHVIFMLLPLTTGIGREHYGRILTGIARLVDEGKLVPLVDRRYFELEDAGRAHEILERGEALGKIVVEVA